MKKLSVMRVSTIRYITETPCKKGETYGLFGKFPKLGFVFALQEQETNSL